MLSPYTSNFKFIRIGWLLVASVILLVACTAPQVSQKAISVSITADGESQWVEVPAGSTVAEALEEIGIALGERDLVNLADNTTLSDGDVITVTRVEEIFETAEEIIPFEQQTIRNESLPNGEQRLLQRGQNGLRELTIRLEMHDGVEVKRSVVRVTVLTQPQPEIMMIGVQSPFTPLPITGRLVYLSGGNAWMMEESTNNRVPLVTTGDLDGRIFALSPDGETLLFTRKSEGDPSEEINTLWILNLETTDAKPIYLRGNNIVHYAGFSPAESNTIFYSTVEPRSTSPGWQANNDLYKVIYGKDWAGTPKLILEPNSGGIYGWWGTTFQWSGNGQLAYARPDSVGLVSFDSKDMGSLNPLIEITPLNTRSDWAWVPGIEWGADNRSLYAVTHAAPGGLVSPEESPNFDLSALSMVNSASITLTPQSGMFAYPSASPRTVTTTEVSYQIAYLQAIFPSQSATSTYRLIVMDRDGSNRRWLFPAADSTGLDPQIPVWSPYRLPSGNFFIAVLYKGDLWLIDSDTGDAQQVTGDSLLTRVDWE